MNGFEAREIMECEVRRELFGPIKDQVNGTPIDCSDGSVTFASKEESRGQFHDSLTKQEILTQSDPLRRYGVGILHGGGSSYVRAHEADDAMDIPGYGGNWSDGSVDAAAVSVNLPERPSRVVADSDDFDLQNANTFKPSAIAFSFRCDPGFSGSLEFEASAAYYDKISAHIPGLEKPRTWWVRRPFTLGGVMSGRDLLEEAPGLSVIQMSLTTGFMPRIFPEVSVFSRPVPLADDSRSRLVTVALVNTSSTKSASEALFQVEFEARAKEDLRIAPYPEASTHERDDEEQSLDLLNRKLKTFAIGHGCAVDWSKPVEDSVAVVNADLLPSYEVPSLTADLYKLNADGTRSRVSVSMRDLASGDPAGGAQLAELFALYEEWIAEKESTISNLSTHFEKAARRHISRCKEALNRMRRGWELVNSDAQVRSAFQLANEAMAIQQYRSRLGLREVKADADGTFRPTGEHPVVEFEDLDCSWRGFQIAFLLSTLPGLVDPSDESRLTVDLIFFPTGGGKTEAYLGVAAVSALLRRLRDPKDAGTDTLMRYTLRLLTAQQFLRAAALICALEDIRSRREDEFGSERFSIGVWLGLSSTPNKWEQARRNLKDLRRSAFAENKFLLGRCPWCGSEMGTKPLPNKQRGTKGQAVLGYIESNRQVKLRCIDSQCRFSKRAGLPVHVVDEDIYATRPTLVIGTVDKFAMLAWQPEAARLFGLVGGAREVSPPSLIVQDELHLISGPLGSMVGLYEAVIEELCTDFRSEMRIGPKIIASTATIRRYGDQVKSLYGRDQVALFPPLGLEEGHSFFAEPKRLKDGRDAPGRRYLGIMSASLGSTQTVQVRLASATLLGATKIPEESRDAYWTNLNFLNSLRELGNTVSLLQADVPDYLAGLRYRDGSYNSRWPTNVLELTSRKKSDEIPEAIERLQRAVGSKDCVDICLASNIIEVGVDIDRLGLMTIVGQPKTTSQYIQVSGRVGRRPDQSPGLVLTIYGAARPRDRSHYERFRTYHERLYAQVEPTSVTPFAKPVLERSLHAALIARMRQRSPELKSHPFPESEFDDALEVVLSRVAEVDPAELEAVRKKAAGLKMEWRNWERTEWSANVRGGNPKQGLMRYAGTLPDPGEKGVTWEIPTSMRSVDAECQLQISLRYQQEAGSQPEDNRG